VPVQVASSAQYIIEQFRATTGCGKLEDGAVKSMYASGRVRLSMLQEPGGGGRAHEGSFVLWQLAPSMWLVEMSVAGQSVAAGSDGRVAWRRTPWLGAHAARGGSRPLRRALQVGIMALPCPAPTGMASLVLHRDAMFLFLPFALFLPPRRFADRHGHASHAQRYCCELAWPMTGGARRRRCWLSSAFACHRSNSLLLLRTPFRFAVHDRKKKREDPLNKTTRCECDESLLKRALGLDVSRVWALHLHSCYLGICRMPHC